MNEKIEIPKTDPISEDPSHIGVAERLRLIDAMQQRQFNNDLASEPGHALEDNESLVVDDSLTIKTVDEFMQTETDQRLTLYLLARAYQRYFNVQDHNQQGEDQQPTENGESASDSYSHAHQVASSRPNWQEHFPKDESEDEILQWDEFKSQYPEYMQTLLDGLYKNKIQLDNAMQNDELMKQVDEEKQTQHEIKQSAILLRAIKHRTKSMQQRIRDIVNLQASEYLPLTREQQEEIDLKSAEVSNLESIQLQVLADLTSEQVKSTFDHIGVMQSLQDRASIKRGFLPTKEMQDIVDKRLASLVNGGRLYLVGETGGAKTALAKYLAREILRLTNHPSQKEGRLVSGYADVNAYQLIGKSELVIDEQTGQPKTEFALGAITKAMEEGVPLIVDEVNAIPPEVLKRLNEIMLLKHGDSYEIQENGGRKVVVQKGFCIIMTANENSHRYKGVHQMSSEMENRLYVNKEVIPYPDSDILIGEIPATNLRLAIASIVDQHGNIPFDRLGITEEQFIGLVKCAHKSQQLFSKPPDVIGNIAANYIDDRAVRSDKPALEEFVLSPRSLVELLTQIKDGGGQYKLTDWLETTLRAITNDSDRHIMKAIYESEGLL